MTDSVLGIIMDIKELGESDLIVTLFSKEKGKLRGIAKGAKRSKRRFFNCLDLFHLTYIELEKKKNNDLFFLHSCKLIEPFARIREDYRLFIIASYIIEIADKLFPLGVTEERIFDLIKDSFFSLQNGRDPEIVLTEYEARAITIAGYRINLEICQSCRRPYKGEGIGVFLAYKGGIVCLKCIKNHYSLTTIRPEEIHILRKLQSGTFKEDSITQKSLRVIRRVLRLHIGYIIGERLKTKRFIDSLFPSDQVP